MFPLGSVTFPGQVLPLSVFEPRYRTLVVDCLADDGTFGTVLIGRGHEVGGGDERTDLGTLVRIVDAETTPDGRWSILTVGIERVEVIDWEPDDPHPRARVAPRPSDPPGRDALERASIALRSFLGLAFELGHLPIEPILDLDDDDLSASWQVCAMSPMGPADRQELLGIDDADRRMVRFVEMIDEQIDLLRFRGPRPV